MKKIVSVILVLVLALALGATAFADSGVPITKNPTDEARSAGGTAWFVSGAANYNSLEWKFMDPAGTFYTVQEFRNRPMPALTESAPQISPSATSELI